MTNKQTVTPAKLVPAFFKPGAGVQNALKGLDSGFRCNDEPEILDTHFRVEPHLGGVGLF